MNSISIPSLIGDIIVVYIERISESSQPVEASEGLAIFEPQID